MWHLPACKISVCLSFLNWIKNDFFLSYSEFMLAKLIRETIKKILSFQGQETD